MLKFRNNKWLPILLVLVLLVGSLATVSANPNKADQSLVFDLSDYTKEKIEVDGETIAFRAWEGVFYVSDPVYHDGLTHGRNPLPLDLETYHILNVYIPEVYFQRNGNMNGFNARTAPIFLPNNVGGWAPGTPQTPDQDRIKYALARGYVVVSAGSRGYRLKDEDGKYNGFNPWNITDMKATVRYLHFNDKIMPGDANKIISAGTSAGGALASQLGASGNHPDYLPYLEAIGALDARDDIFAAAPYCPITNLNNTDTAYEWQFRWIYDYSGAGYAPGTLLWGNDEGEVPEILHAHYLAGAFPEYVNSLGLIDLALQNTQGRGLSTAPGQVKQGTPLTLDINGNGPFKDYVISALLDSAQKALDNGYVNVDEHSQREAPEDVDALTIEDGIVNNMDFFAYNSYLTRMKKAPSFSYVVPNNGGQYAFGNEDAWGSYYTDYSYENRIDDAFPRTDPLVVKMMNPMDYIGDDDADTAQYWRIRHGASDRDTSFAIPVILALALENNGMDVDFEFPWGVGHGGFYDLEELFDWIDSISK